MGLGVLCLVQLIYQQMEGQGGQAEAVALEHVVAQQRNALAEAKVWVLHIYVFSFPGVWSIILPLSPCLWPKTVSFLDVATGACDY